MNDFVRLREESSYLEMGMTLEGGSNGLNDLMADDDDNYQLGEDGGHVCIGFVLCFKGHTHSMLICLCHKRHSRRLCTATALSSKRCVERGGGGDRGWGWF